MNRNQNNIVPNNVRQQQNVHPGMRHPSSNNNIPNDIMGNNGVPPHFTNNNVHGNFANKNVPGSFACNSQLMATECR